MKAEQAPRPRTKIFFALPAFGGLCYAYFVQSLIDGCKKLDSLGIEWHCEWLLHESLVQRARNILVDRFLASDATHLMFIDADIAWRPDDLVAMIDTDLPMVCGAYPVKGIQWDNVKAAILRGEEPEPVAARYAVNPAWHEASKAEKNADGTTTLTWTPHQGTCIPVLDAATGFLLVKRHVFFEMAKPEWLYFSDSPDTRGRPMVSFFDCAIRDGRYLSEDYLFSRRWQDIGGTVWLYVPAVLKHVGSYVYSADLLKQIIPSEDPTPSDNGTLEWSDIPALPNGNTQKNLHLYRYAWANAHLQSRTVANAACGSGYGNAALLFDHSERQVRGFDRSHQALAIANRKYAGDNSSFAAPCDIEQERMAGFRAVVSLETLEHLKDPWGWLGRLSPDVRELILSVPIVPTKHYNQYHLHDFTETEIRYGLANLGWRITDTEYQDEGQPKAVLLVRAERP